jgi:hypothetical protein
MFQKVIKWCQGRHTMFAIYFAVMGTVLAWCHRLDMNFIALIGAVQGFVFLHSGKEDWFSLKAQVGNVTSTPSTDPQPGGEDAAK